MARAKPPRRDVERLMPVHKKRVLSYLRLSEVRLGLLLNFGEAVLKNGTARLVNGLSEWFVFASPRLCARHQSGD